MTVETWQDISIEFMALYMKTIDVLDAYKVAVDQLLEDLAFATGTPREILIERYLGAVAEVASSK